MSTELRRLMTVQSESLVCKDSGNRYRPIMKKLGENAENMSTFYILILFLVIIPAVVVVLVLLF